MFFLRIQSDKTLDYINTLGGSQADTGLKLIAYPDGYVYALGEGYSTELTNGQSLDWYLLRYTLDGKTLDYFYHFGGNNQDFATDLKVYGTNLYLMGYSISAGLSSGSFDIIIVSVTKLTVQVNWIRRLGTASFPTYSNTIAVYPTDGSLYMTGTISAV